MKIRQPFTLNNDLHCVDLAQVLLVNCSLYPDRDRRNSGQKPTKLGKIENNYDIL